MKTKNRKPFAGHRLLAVGVAALLASPVAGLAQFTTPHLINSPGDVTNVLGATTFINHGLVAIGHISASALDSFGETFGSCSSMQITGWTTNGDGTYNGTLNILPDRGYNTGNFYADYAARINQVGFTFKPYYGSANIGGATDLEKLNAQTNQLTFGAITGVKFTYDDPNTGLGSFTTGLDPGTNSTTLFGQTMPYVTTFVGQQSPSITNLITYPGINKLPLDSEALILKPDGSGYVGDEYGANIYYFDATKKIIGAIVPPPAMQPHSPTNVLNYSSAITPLNGRRNNQGFEGVSLSPDGTRLFALQQSACVQDSDAANNQRAKNTRLLVYDVGTNPTNSTPLAEYALTLPTYKGNGNGGAVDKTCAQSEIVALDNRRFLVLPRDGNGLGNSVTNPNVYKAVLLVDTTVGAPLNLAGDSARNAEGGRITTASGVLDPAITPLNWVEAVNMLNTNQLAKFNVAWDSGTNQVTKLTMGEKWEGMALVPANDPANPNDYFLFVGNDNDFVTSAGQMRSPDGSIVSYNAFNGYPASRIPAPLDSPNNENDTRILVFRVTIATAFTAGDLILERMGDGSAALGSTGTPVFIHEYTASGDLLQTKALPQAFPRPAGSPFNLMDSGSATSNGQLTRSADGRFICIPGLNGTNGEVSIASSSAATVLRVMGTLDASGALSTAQTAAMLTGNNFRSLTSSDGTNFWAVGQPGLVYYQPGVATNSLLTSNLRCVRIFNNQLYISSGSGTPGVGVSVVGSGLPTNGTPATSLIIPVGGSSPSPYEFEINPGNNICYVADDRANAAGGIIKYTNNGSAWVSNYTLATVSAANFGARGLAVDWSGPNPVIYATTAETSTNRLIRIVDTNSSATAVTLATSPTNTAFRGLAFAPVNNSRPTIISQTVLGNGSFQMTFSGQASQTYKVAATTNLAQLVGNWLILTNGVLGSTPATYTDTGTVGLPQRFYLLVSP